MQARAVAAAKEAAQQAASKDAKEKAISAFYRLLFSSAGSGPRELGVHCLRINKRPSWFWSYSGSSSLHDPHNPPHHSKKSSQP